VDPTGGKVNVQREKENYDGRKTAPRRGQLVQQSGERNEGDWGVGKQKDLRVKKTTLMKLFSKSHSPTRPLLSWNKNGKEGGTEVAKLVKSNSGKAIGCRNGHRRKERGGSISGRKKTNYPTKMGKGIHVAMSEYEELTD